MKNIIFIRRHGMSSIAKKNSRNGLIMKTIFLILFLFFSSSSYTQYINKGIWSIQQPADANDGDYFYGGSGTYEGWCGPNSLALGIQYFIPDIHKKLYDKYGSVDYHTGDSRGGLKDADPYVYHPTTTYTFVDFLCHKYIGYHVSSSGVGYSALTQLLDNLNNDILGYTLDRAWITLGEMRTYLENGYLIEMNTYQGGGHYIPIIGWDGSTTNASQRYYYIWDTWYNPLGLSSSQYITVPDEWAGNSNNLGTPSYVSTYKVDANVLTDIYRDQLGNGTVLAYKFTPNGLPQDVTDVTAKGIWVLGSSIASEGANVVVDNLAAHGITDIFLLVKDGSGNFTTQKLADVIPLAHANGIKVHAWISVLNDGASASSYTTVGTDWIDPQDANYKDYIINTVIDQICDLDIDGIILDDINYPGNASSYTGATTAITTYCQDIRNKMDAKGRITSTLSASILPEGSNLSIDYGQDLATMTQSLNFVIPNTFTHKYKESGSWVGNNIAYFNNNVSANCEVWAGIEVHDNNDNYMTPLEMKYCANFAYDNGATSIAYYRYPLRDWQWEFSDNISVNGSIVQDTSTTIIDTTNCLNGKSLWVWGTTLANVGYQTFIDEMAAHDITDVFVLVKGVSGFFTTQKLQAVIPIAHDAGIKIHAWVIVLNDEDKVASYSSVGGSWINATDVNYRNYIINTVVDEICNYNIDGIHLDCIRYPGNANNYSGSQAAITEYCNQVRQKMDAKGKYSAVLSAAIMPEDVSTAVIYGQDVSQMTQYLEFITPMTYTHNYNTQPDWVGSQTAWFLDNVVPGTEVWAGIQTRDDLGIYMSVSEMDACIQSAIDNGAQGVAYFVYPITSSQWGVSDQLVACGTIPGYCDAGIIGGLNEYEYIDAVTFSTISTSGTGLGPGGYQSHLTDTAFVSINGSYAIDIAIDYITSITNIDIEKAKVWIDFNQNLSFDDPGEMVYESTVGSGPFSGTINIPATATIGNTRMRIRIWDTTDGPLDTSCGDSKWGEVEDYTVNISDVSLDVLNDDVFTEIVVYPNPSTGVFTVRGKNISEIIITNLQGKQILSKKTSRCVNNISLQNYKKGIYFINIITDNKTIIKKVIIL